MDDPRTADPVAQEIARNRDRQSAIYGEPLDERIRRLTTGLGITQARLAAAVGLSPAEISAAFESGAVHAPGEKN